MIQIDKVYQDTVLSHKHSENPVFWGKYASDPSVLSNDGDFYWNTNDNNLLVYISGSWISLGGSAPVSSYLLMETGDYLLTESGDKFILE